jgi:hypothetical protein
MMKDAIISAVYETIGKESDEWLAQARRSAAEARGGSVALRAGAKSLEGLSASVRNELDAGKLELPETPAELAKILIVWLSKAHQSITRTADHLDRRGLALEGEVAAYDKVNARLAQSYQAARARLDAKRNGSIDLHRDSSGASGHPGPTLKQQRQEEERQKERKTDTREAKHVYSYGKKADLELVLKSLGIPLPKKATKPELKRLLGAYLGKTNGTDS